VEIVNYHEKHLCFFVSLFPRIPKEYKPILLWCSWNSHFDSTINPNGRYT